MVFNPVSARSTRLRADETTCSAGGIERMQSGKAPRGGLPQGYMMQRRPTVGKKLCQMALLCICQIFELS